MWCPCTLAGPRTFAGRQGRWFYRDIWKISWLRIEFFFFSAKSKLEYLMRKLSSYLLSVFVWKFYLNLKYFLSIVLITIQSFKTLIECHLKKDEEVWWRWQAVIKMLITCSQPVWHDRSEVPNYASQNNQGWGESIHHPQHPDETSSYSPLTLGWSHRRIL